MKDTDDYYFHYVNSLYERQRLLDRARRCDLRGQWEGDCEDTREGAIAPRKAACARAKPSSAVVFFLLPSGKGFNGALSGESPVRSISALFLRDERGRERAKVGFGAYRTCFTFDYLQELQN